MEPGEEGAFGGASGKCPPLRQRRFNSFFEEDLVSTAKTLPPPPRKAKVKATTAAFRQRLFRHFHPNPSLWLPLRQEAHRRFPPFPLSRKNDFGLPCPPPLRMSLGESSAGESSFNRAGTPPPPTLLKCKVFQKTATSLGEKIAPPR